MAKKILLKYNGDVVNSIINIENCEDPNDLIKEENYEHNDNDDIDETEVEVSMNKENLENDNIVDKRPNL